MAECGGLLNVPRFYRFNPLNNLQMEVSPPKWGEVPHSGVFAPHFAPRIILGDMHRLSNPPGAAKGTDRFPSLHLEKI